MRARVRTPAEQLCLQCGLCCNGVIFADGQLQPEDNVDRLKSLGLKLKRGGKFYQPCSAFTDRCCAIYADRPSYCRRFECALLKAVDCGELSAEKAEIIIKRALRRVATVERLLQKVGDSNPGSPLSRRFHRAAKRLQSAEVDAQTASSFSELTVAMHQLNLLLSERFYPRENP